MAEERKTDDLVKELENAETTELEDKDLEGAAGGAEGLEGDNNCGCINSPCDQQLDNPSNS